MLRPAVFSLLAFALTAGLLGCPDALRATPDAGPDDGGVPEGAAEPPSDGSPSDAGASDAPPSGSWDDGPREAGDGAAGVNLDGSALDAAGDADRPGIEIIADNLGVGAQPASVAVDRANVYFSDNTGYSVYQCPKASCLVPGGPKFLGEGHTDALFADDSRVYWDHGTADNGVVSLGVVACTIGGCQTPGKVVSSAETFGVADGHVYWTDSGSVLACALPDCASQTTLATDQGIVSMSAEAGTVYWLSRGDLRACASGGCGGTPSVVVGGLFRTGALVVHAGVAYWAMPREVQGVSIMSIVSCPVTGCAAPKEIGFGADSPAALAVDDTHVYWMDSGNMGVYRCPIAGCTGAVEAFSGIQTGLGDHANVALDDEYVYWAADGRVLRRHK